MTHGDLTTNTGDGPPLTCSRCHQPATRLIRPYWRTEGTPALCPPCCDAATAHYEALPEGWPPNPTTGTRPPKLAALQTFWDRHHRFPTDAERCDDGTLLEPPEPEPEETPEW